jgi:RNA polymerase sigma-70 factor (ECF subfamily)
VIPDDRHLISESLAGRTASFGVLVLRYQDRLYHVANRVLDNPDDALDVVQDTFVNAYLSLASFKGDAEFFTWLYRIAFNTAISAKRRKRSAVSLDAGTGKDGNIGIDPEDRAADVAPGAAMERSEDERLLAEAVAKLSPEHRAVLLMKDIDGLKYEDIAEVMGVPIGTVRSRLHRARVDLRNLLEPGSLGVVEQGAGTAKPD